MGIKRRRGTNSAAQDGNTTSKDADTTSQGVTPWMFWGVAVVAVVLAVSGSTTLLPTHPSRQQAATQPPSVKVSANARPGNKMRQYKDPVPHTVESVLFSAPTRYGTLQTVEAFVVHDFLPIDLATRWRDALLKEWEVPDRGDSGSSSKWVFTSNNNGSGPSAGGGNAKIRGNHDIARRQEVANEINKGDHFAYRKWELPQGHPILVDVLRHMESQATLRQVGRILRLKKGAKLYSKTIELFVTQYAEGDFLNKHDDAIGDARLPTWAFVVSLTHGKWQDGFGGELEFLKGEPGAMPSWDQRFVPEFNRAMFFRTSDPGGPFHRVAPVTKKAMDAGWRRFGYTGWYTVEKKGRSDEEIKNIIRNNLGGVDLLYATEEERAELAQDPLLA